MVFFSSNVCRWHFEIPSILEGSILIMSNAGTGTAMFSMGEILTSFFLFFFILMLYLFLFLFLYDFTLL